MKQKYAREIAESIASLYTLTELEADAINSIIEPKPLVEKEIGEGDRAELVECCPNCSAEISNSMYQFCPICGQPILQEE